MKKSKLLVTLLLAGTMATSVGALAACGGHKCESKCPTCNSCQNAECEEDVCKDKCTCENETLAQSITKGTFRMDAEKRYELIKFYEDGTFYAYGMMTEVVRGKYKVHENYETPIKYVDCGDNGNADDGETTVLTANKAVEFFEEDGTTPSAQVVRKDDDIPKGSNLDNAMAKNIVAYTDGWLHHVKIGAQTRSLKQNKNAAFTKDDESAVLEKTFMVTEDNDKIGGIVTQQKLTLELYDKKFVDKVSGDEDIEGKLSKNGNVYTLTYPDGTATFTVSADGTTATWVKGTKTIEYVIYADAVPVAVQLSGTKLPVSMTLYENGEVKGSMTTQQGPANIKGTYSVNDGTITFDITEGKLFDITSATYAEGKVTVEISAGGGSMTDELKGDVTGELYVDDKVAVELAFTGAPVNLKLYESGAVKGTMTTQQGPANITGTYVVKDGNIEFTLASGTPFEITTATYTDGKVTVNLTAGGGAVNGKCENVTPTGTLLSVKLAKTVEGWVSAETNKMNISVTFYNNGTVNIGCSAIGLSVTGKYTASSTTGLTVTDIGDMSLTQSGLSLTLGGTVTIRGNSAPISATFTCTQNELGALLR